MIAANPFAVAVEALRHREELFLAQGACCPFSGLADVRAALALFERLAAVEVEAFTGSYRHEEGQSFRTPLMVPVDHRADYSTRWAGVVQDEACRDPYSVDGDPAEIAEHQALCLLAAALECRRRSLTTPTSIDAILAEVPA